MNTKAIYFYADPNETFRVLRQARNRNYALTRQRSPGLHVSAPPEDSEDSCLSDSAGSDEEYVSKPGDEESNSESDRSSSDEENVVKPGESGFKISTSTSQIFMLAGTRF